MSDEELIQKLEEFAEHLSVSNIFTDSILTLGWLFLKGLAFLVDGLENVTNEVLLVKDFFQNPEVVAFVQTVRPFLYILLAFSLLFTGYMMIFQKKIEREAIAINIFIAIIIVGLLAPSMDKANEFTDVAVSSVQTNGGLYADGEGGTVSENILSRNITDLLEFDKNSFSNKDIEPTNTIPLSLIHDLKITQKFDKDDLSSNDAQEISKHYIVWTSTGKDVDEFDQGGLEWNNEYYYRYDVNWFTAIVTLLVMGFTLFSIAYKLARLGFELTFNYVLAILIAPADVHDGQKTKKVLQSILNTFLVIILIFVSMKVYIFGTSYLANNFEGLPYLIALIGFSVALIDGPNMVERIFGIDAGLKSGWGLLAGAYAGGKALASTGKLLSNATSKGLSGNNNENTNSPNDSKGENKNNASGIMNAINKGQNALSEGSDNLINKDMENTDSNVNAPSLANGISEQAETSTQQGKNIKAPSPNDSDRGVISELQAQAGNNGGTSNSATTLDEQMGAQSVSQTGGINGGVTPLGNQQSLSPNGPNNGSLDGGTQQQTQSFEQRSAVQMNSEITQTSEQLQGAVNVLQNSTGAGSSAVQQVAAGVSNDIGNSPVNSNAIIQGGSTQQTRVSHVQGNGNDVTVNDEIIVNNSSQQVNQGSTTVRETGGGVANFVSGGNSFIPSESNQSQNFSEENNVVNNTNTTSQLVTNTTTVNNDNINHVQQENQTNVNSVQQDQVSEYTRLRPSKYTMNRPKNFRKK